MKSFTPAFLFLLACADPGGSSSAGDTALISDTTLSDDADAFDVDTFDVDTFDVDAGENTDIETEVSTDATPDASTDSTNDVSPETVPLIGEVLDCGVFDETGSIPPGTSATPLIGVTLDTTQFPDALCNDGSPAIMYVRPAETAAGASRWVLQLVGGGGCSSPDICAQRWCGVGTSLSGTQMSSTNAPNQTNGLGIFARPSEYDVPSPQPFADANQVLLKYCSSDIWRGTARDVLMDTVHPRSGEEVQFRAHFLGRRILEAAILTLRQDGVEPIDYRPTSSRMPDLDDASEVVLAGASAGGGGTTYNLDWLSTTLQVSNPEVVVRGLIDSTFGPSGIEFDFSESTLCLEREICSAQALFELKQSAQTDFWAAAAEESCRDFHASTGDGWLCASDTHVMLNHLGNPFFVRQGLSDPLISEMFVESGALYEGNDVVMSTFATLVRSNMDRLGDLANTSEEAPTGLTAGAFGPQCPKHETLRHTENTFFATIRTSPGERYAMFDVWNAWLADEDRGILYTREPSDTSCP